VTQFAMCHQLTKTLVSKESKIWRRSALPFGAFSPSYSSTVPNLVFPWVILCRNRHDGPKSTKAPPLGWVVLDR